MIVIRLRRNGLLSWYGSIEIPGCRSEAKLFGGWRRLAEWNAMRLGERLSREGGGDEGVVVISK